MAEKEHWLIAGLGNPGRRYAKNRHNVGFQCLDALARAHGLAFDRRKSKGKLALGRIEGHAVILLKPQTFMNDSGRSLASVKRFYQVPLERLLVIYDDLDLPLGSVRLRAKGGSGGHKGMHSIIAQMGEQDFARMRVGIGRPPGHMDPADFVLQDFGEDQLPVIQDVYDWVVRAVECWLGEGVEMAMTRCNRLAE
jgi:PTH1 family peptidyl-tRNA hydrolase